MALGGCREDVIFTAERRNSAEVGRFQTLRELALHPRSAVIAAELGSDTSTLSVIPGDRAGVGGLSGEGQRAEVRALSS